MTSTHLASSSTRNRPSVNAASSGPVLQSAEEPEGAGNSRSQSLWLPSSGMPAASDTEPAYHRGCAVGAPSADTVS